MKKWLITGLVLGCCILAVNQSLASEFDFTVDTEKSVDEALDSVKSELKKEGFKIPGVHALPVPNDYVLVEVCYPPEVKKIVAANPKLGLLCPCAKIGVYEDPTDGNKTKISLLLPSASMRIYPSEEVWGFVTLLTPRLKQVVTRAK